MPTSLPALGNGSGCATSQEHILPDLAVDLLILLSNFCLDCRQRAFLLIVPNGQFLHETFAGWLVIIVGMLSHVEMVGVFAFGKRRVIQLPTTSQCPEEE